MKLINQKPTLVLSANELHALEVVDELLDNLEAEDCDAIDAVLEDSGWTSCDIDNLRGLLQAIIEEGMVAGSATAKALVVEYTAELVIG
jgi:hypothetical protein